MTILGEVGTAVRTNPGEVIGSIVQALGWLPLQTVDTVTTAVEGQDNVVARLEVLNFGADFFNDPGTFVTQDNWVADFSITLPQGFIGVADPGGYHVNLEVIWLHLCQFNVVTNIKLSAFLIYNSSFDFHNKTSP